MGAMATDFTAVFTALKPVLAKHANRMAVKADTPVEYTLVTKSPSPFLQHKGHPLEFGSVKVGKAYVSFHLMPLYMSDALSGAISDTLSKRMQGKSCFNFKAVPGPSLEKELKTLTEACYKAWNERNWL